MSFLFSNLRLSAIGPNMTWLVMSQLRVQRADFTC
uniref:Uncharacterized protein n=1 Tax=Anguilla anguilla TaxID=7936 RepID=A0A0E9XSS0_ANGAN